MSEKFSRADRLYILAKALSDKHLTPDSPTYAGFIIGVSAANFYRDKTAALEDAETLTSAYRFDKWQSILNGDEQPLPENTTTQVSTQQESYSITPTLFDLKTYTLKSPCTPINTIPKKHIYETEPTPKTQAQILLRLAENDMFNGVARISLAQARYELNDKSLQLNDVLQLMQRYLPSINFETRPGNIILCYIDGKDTTRSSRDLQRIVQPAPKLFHALPTPKPIEYEKDAEYNRDKTSLPETIDDSECDVDENLGEA